MAQTTTPTSFAVPCETKGGRPYLLFHGPVTNIDRDYSATTGASYTIRCGVDELSVTHIDRLLKHTVNIGDQLTATVDPTPIHPERRIYLAIALDNSHPVHVEPAR